MLAFCSRVCVLSAYTYIYLPWERLSDHSLLSFMRVLACSVELWLSLLSCYSIYHYFASSGILNRVSAALVYLSLYSKGRVQ